MTEPFSFDVYDYLVLGISIVITLISIWKGLINSILSLLTWIGSILITIYSWNWFSNFLIVDQLNKINLLNENPINKYIGMMISIPIIFLITLFILKKFRKIITDDIDKQFLGKLLDKVFGLFYGLLFSYILFSAVLHLSDELEKYLPNKLFYEESCAPFFACLKNSLPHYPKTWPGIHVDDMVFFLAKYLKQMT